MLLFVNYLINELPQVLQSMTTSSGEENCKYTIILADMNAKVGSKTDF